ncbi:hypothetical protein I203_102043 [Kwoniella mangroviensis CBS 8507]|uniref:uncharacterized protein n=1 Tax=Kwoniella mangroviensis CBS 8507 TaxID=1296122 RepID=UPI00080D61DB|nr:uncharacterized protein I203_03238 [Kwoniella mangroviensis CBS 8507]OCF67541.1 hypothetical protein I203_03238 [Kwoniella mangroviensis CBS 8507]
MPPSNQNQDHCMHTFVLPSLPKLGLPPLPPITDSKLREMVFTHASLSNVPRSYSTSVFLEEGQGSLDYEKLEHIGDALLEAIAVSLAHELYPNFRQGSASIMRHQLVSNATLAQISCQYGLPNLLKSEPSLRFTLRRNEKVQASIFEAYIAAVYYSYLGGGDIITAESSRSLQLAQSSTPSSSLLPSVADPSQGEDAQPDSGSDGESEDSDQEYFDAESTTESDTDNNAGSGESDESTDYYDGIEIIFKDLSSDEDKDMSSSNSQKSFESLPSPQLNDSPDNTTSSDTIVPRKTRGEAYDYLFQWLRQVLKPIARFAVEHLEVEEKRIQQKYNRVPEPVFIAPASWKEEDEKARGGKNILHCHFQEGEFPTYTESRLPGNPNTSPWKVVCTVTDDSGKEWTAEATRFTKRDAANVAAWKVCIAMGLIKADE